MEPELNRDYFWTLERVAEYALQTSLHISDKLHSPLLLQPDYRPSAQDAAKEERTRTDHRLKKVARNSKNPYAAAPIAEMLESTGWLCFQDSAAAGGAHAGGDVMFVPYWKAKHFNAQNYKAGALGVDYHNSRTLLDHLEVSRKSFSCLPYVVNWVGCACTLHVVLYCMVGVRQRAS